MLNTDDADIRYGRIVIKFEADNLTNEQLQLIGGLVGMGFEENCRSDSSFGESSQYGVRWVTRGLACSNHVCYPRRKQ